ncbi:GNAT family N-acetyltransferase [Anaerocolumna xylanovorans]|uniref:Uncharacterized lipoprotein YddW, UPF0748 family n=1 Tax=Anaerocolumna xylanovorans DSM 12503 TaxID=1121345 RepID=A0A1M7XWE0_9FIRM|nr:GNAT family N-acetyltransferase [Anaerocolumna xylanovorans]SHO43050.1 Uncharacterized lipoprotein YddW, UPF0748 family [Anaerocolumna xylanovorans DSM 12503]
MNSNYFVWIEIEANKRTITNAACFEQAMEKCRAAGIDAVILSVKDTTGFVIYESEIAPHYAEYDEAFEKKDYLKECLETAHRKGLKFYASIDVFAEGNKRKPHEKMPGILRKDWQTYVYGIDEAKKPVIQPVSEKAVINTIGSIDDFGEIFVNPANEEVCSYELSLLNEIMQKYTIDGIVLDRVRYVGLSSDFGPVTKKKWEQQFKDVCSWPEDIYRIKEEKGKLQIEYGNFFGEFLNFRAKTITDFVKRVRKLVDSQDRRLEFLDYTGSWYPLYYHVGANWASKDYDAREYPFVDIQEYKKTGYAEQLDGLLSGFYYPHVTEQEAEEARQPAFWYSVEGAARLAGHVTQNAVTVVGSLFLEQYRENLEDMTRAIRMCFEKSHGCMLFDLSYLVDNDWWSYVSVNEQKGFFLEPLQENDLTELIQLWSECFPEEFQVSAEHLHRCTFLDEQFCPEASLCIRSREGQRLLGAILCKKSESLGKGQNSNAWITALLIKPEFQNRGLGTHLYLAAQKVLSEKPVGRIYAGQDYHNIFSGIPAPDEKKTAFFRKMGFQVNTEEHYDLTADLFGNDKIDRFDTSSFQEKFYAEVLKMEEKQELYRFLQEEFPGIWAESMEEYLENGGSPCEIIVLKELQNRKIAGFCKVHGNCDQNGELGPIGIARAVRGNHAGEYLLHQSLLHLRNLQCNHIRIDWTILKDFYGIFGFQPYRAYRGAVKEL